MSVLDALREAARHEPLRLRISGSCMEPALLGGRQVEVVASRLYWPGDILVFARRDGRLVAHRFLGYRPGLPMRVFTQADHSPQPDSAVARDEIVGRVVVRVGAADRLRALARFARLVGARLGRRLP